MVDTTFFTQLKTATQHVQHAIHQLDDALAASEARLFVPAKRRLLQVTRNNLRRHHRILLDLTSQAMKITYPTNPFPRFLEQHPSAQEKCGKSPSPQNGQ